MSESLFPVIDVPEFFEDDGLYDNRYHPSVKWDFEKGDFVRDGANKLIDTDGRDAYKIWCVKAVSTERYTCIAYPREIGTEMDSAMKEPVPEAVESAVERTITEALLVNPRTEYVREFEFESVGDEMRCSFVAKGINHDEFKLSVILRGGED